MKFIFKSFLVYAIAGLLFSIGAQAVTTTCAVSVDGQTQKVTFTSAGPNAIIKIGNEPPQKIYRSVQLKMTSAQVDKCHFGKNEAQFHKCLDMTFGTVDEYQEMLPTLFAYIRWQEKSGVLSLGFDTSKIAVGKMHYRGPINPAFGASVFVQFFDRQSQLLGQILDMGAGQLLECK